MLIKCYVSFEELRKRLIDARCLPISVNTVKTRTLVAQDFASAAKDQLEFCENLVHEQHLQQQGMYYLSYFFIVCVRPVEQTLVLEPVGFYFYFFSYDFIIFLPSRIVQYYLFAIFISGWFAVIANLDDITVEFRKRWEIFQSMYEEFIADRATYDNFLLR